MRDVDLSNFLSSATIPQLIKGCPVIPISGNNHVEMGCFPKPDTFKRTRGGSNRVIKLIM